VRKHCPPVQSQSEIEWTVLDWSAPGLLATRYPVGYPAQTSAFRGQFFCYDTGVADFYHLGNELDDVLCKLRGMEDD